MKIDLTKLITNIIDSIIVKDIIQIDKSMLVNTDIKDISEVIVDGVITSNGDNFEINMNIKCTLILQCSISLKDVEYNIDIDINEIVSNCDENIEENNKIINNTIDLIPIIWQNIILEVPLKVISSDIDVKNIQGDGWRFVTDEGDIKKEIDPRLEGLKKFLNE